MRAFDASRVGAAVAGATAGTAPATSAATARCGTSYPRTRGVLTPCTALSRAESGTRTHRLAAILTTVLVVPACGGEGGPGSVVYRHRSKARATDAQAHTVGVTPVPSSADDIVRYLEERRAAEPSTSRPATVPSPAPSPRPPAPYRSGPGFGE